MKITVVGTGYVGLSLAVLLSQENSVIALDIVPEKIELINQRKSPIVDDEIQDFFDNKVLYLTGTLDKKIAYNSPQFIIVATPTDYDEKDNFFNTSSVDSTIEDISRYSPSSIIVLKSTLPIGYTQKVRSNYPNLKIIFSPEFLREGRALYDNLYPSRIIVSNEYSESVIFGELLRNASLKDSTEIQYTGSNEAESIKLFSNTYLAMRVSFFNELDTFAEVRGFNSKEIISGMGLDSRIGSHYNNPSFGYGGYCLPKDSKQMLANYGEIPQDLITAIVSSNNKRKKYIAKTIMEKNPKIIGVYRLIMKTGSDNFRHSSILDVMSILNDNGIKVVIYEPVIKSKKYEGYSVISNLNDFKNQTDLIITNRLSADLDSVIEKVYTRDIFSID